MSIGGPEELPRGGLLFPLGGYVAVCLYIDRYRTKYRGNLRFGPPFSEGFRFALSGSGNISFPVFFFPF
jgi:hypothetical protein